MLNEIGVESYYVLINTERGSVSAETPANLISTTPYWPLRNLPRSTWRPVPRAAVHTRS